MTLTPYDTILAKAKLKKISVLLLYANYMEGLNHGTCLHWFDSGPHHDTERKITISTVRLYNTTYMYEVIHTDHKQI